MSIPYKIIPRKKPGDNEAAPMFYASINTTGNRDIRYIAKQIADRSSLNEMDILSVIEGFLQIIPSTLIDGYTADLGDFGHMRLVAKSNPADTEENFNAEHIKRVKVIFRPGKLFRNKLQDAQFKKIGNT